MDEKSVNNRPIIAILAQDIQFEGETKSYIAASYVKFVESSGGRVVPILTSFDYSTLKHLFSCVNGLLIPGGAADLPGSKIYDNTKIFFDLALEANKKGDYFPIWGTCLGFETLPIIVAGTPDVLTSCKLVDVALPLDLTEGAEESRLFKPISPTLLNAVMSENVTYNWHEFGFKIEKFETNDKLKNFFQVLSTNTDDSGETFVSTYEAKEFPFYGVMWHPEKNNFEFRKAEGRNNVPHTSNAVKLSQYMANFFVNEAKKNQHSFSSTEDEEKYLIYGYSTVRPESPYFEEVYLF